MTRVLVDHCTPALVVDVASKLMPDVEFVKAQDVAADRLANGDLHSFIVDEGFDKLLTSDVKMAEETIPQVPVVVIHLREGMLVGELRDIGEDSVELLSSAREIKYHPVMPREGSTRHASRRTRALKIEKYGLRPDRDACVSR